MKFQTATNAELKTALEICKIKAAKFSRRVAMIQREIKRRKKAAKVAG